MMSAIKYQKELIEDSAEMLLRDLPEDASPGLQTFCAIAIELMKSSTASRLRDAARLVEMRDITKGLR